MANDYLLQSIAPQTDLAATNTGVWVPLGKYRDYRVRVIVGGDVTGTTPGVVVTVQGATDAAGAGATTIATAAQIIDEMVGYVATTTPRHEVPGEEPVLLGFYMGAYTHARVVATISGTATPTFNDFTADFVPLKTATRRSGTL